MPTLPMINPTKVANFTKLTIQKKVLPALAQ